MDLKGRDPAPPGPAEEERVTGETSQATEDAPASFFVRHRYLLLLALGLLLYLPFLGLRDMWYPDEPDTGEVCQAMFLSGDWVAPRRMGVIWVDYPPMQYWVGCISAHLLGGISEFTLRLPIALAAIALVLLTSAAASQWFGARAGLWAGFVLLTFQHFSYEAVNYRPDMLFALAIAAGLFLCARGAAEPARWWMLAAGFAMFGLAMLAKGPLGLLLPGLVLTLWHGSRREWRRVLWLAPLSMVALAVYLPWFAACARAMGSDNILYELWAQNFQRFLSGGRGHGQPVYYYLRHVWTDLAPWALLVPFAVYWIHRVRLWRDRHVQLALWWSGAFLVFLTLAATKRQVYLLPAYPAAALLLGPWIAAFWEEKAGSVRAPSPRPVRLYGIVLAVFYSSLALGLLAVTAAFEPFVARIGMDPTEIAAARALRAPVALFSAVLLAAGLWIGQAWRRDDARALLCRVGVAILPLFLVLVAWLLPAMNPTKSYREQGRWIRERIGSETHFGLVGPNRMFARAKMGAFGFYSGALVELLERREDVERFLRERPASVVLVREEAMGKIFSGDEAGWRSRVVRELRAGRHRYLVLAGPPPAAGPAP